MSNEQASFISKVKKQSRAKRHLYYRNLHAHTDFLLPMQIHEKTARMAGSQKQEKSD